ncbi:hypothetical protein [Bradyrhizobium sp. CCBAU 11434]|uniref:hypothetical protein n=2 Tax=Nitrobacteraceae TaxID=41294 RepID=UPI0023064CE3|nr:hypothetical protein [Bradyrhizobium sp. CCBAU 11434]MCG2637698.1 hypothetical protein [Bradyrhizobium zhengyangense]
MMWRRNGANLPNQAFQAGVAQMQLGFPEVPIAPGAEKPENSASFAYQIGWCGFTQSWIVMMHSSRAGNVRLIWEGHACEIEMPVD